MAKIILSYRRSDARATAGRICDKLAAHFGSNSIYMDIDNIPFGSDFRKHIDGALSEGDVVVAVIGPKWLGAVEGGKARILDDTDPVRIEIETALRRRIAIIPILVDGASMPTAVELPDSIKEFSFCNAADVDDGRDFHQHMERVIRSIDDLLKGSTVARTDLGQPRWRLATAAGVAALALLLVAGWMFGPQLRQQLQRVTGASGPTSISPSGATPPSPPLSETLARAGPPKANGIPANRTNSTGAGRRVALLVGMSDYLYAARLLHPANDAVALGALFKSAGFDIVEVRRNLPAAEFRRAIRDAATAARDADIAVVYYSGHGIELAGVNYLIPVDAKLATDFDIEDEAVSLDRIMAALGSAKRLQLALLDAGRDNPFARTMRRTSAARAMSKGLARVEPSNDALVAFSAKAGTVALDGTGPHSPYTTALLKHLAAPGLDIRLVLGRVRDEVLKATSMRQEPFVYGALGGETVSVYPPAEANALSKIRRDFELAEQDGTREAWDRFLAAYGTGHYADLARAQRAKLERKQ